MSPSFHARGHSLPKVEVGGVDITDMVTDFSFNQEIDYGGDMFRSTTFGGVQTFTLELTAKLNPSQVRVVRRLLNGAPSLNLERMLTCDRSSRCECEECK